MPYRTSSDEDVANHQASKQQYPHFFSQIALESISEHVTTKIFWGSAPRPPPRWGAFHTANALCALVIPTIHSSSTPLSQILATPLVLIIIIFICGYKYGYTQQCIWCVSGLESPAIITTIIHLQMKNTCTLPHSPFFFFSLYGETSR